MKKWFRGPWKQKLILILSLLGFANLVGGGLMQPLWSAVRGETPGQGAQNPIPEPSGESALVTQERGYGLVLQREPNNETALRGLVDTRTQLGDEAGAIAALDQLIALHPEDKALKAERATLAAGLPPTSTPPGTPPTP